MPKPIFLVMMPCNIFNKDEVESKAKMCKDLVEVAGDEYKGMFIIAEQEMIPELKIQVLSENNTSEIDVDKIKQLMEKLST